MSKPKKILGLVLALAVVASLVTGVAFWSLGLEVGESEKGLYLDGRQVEDPAPVITVGTYEVPFNIYRYFFLQVRYSLSSGGNESYWDHDPDGSRLQDLLTTVEEYVKYYYTWLDIAAQYNIVLDEEELAEIDAVIEEQKEQFGNQFQERLDGFFVADEETYREINYMETLTNKAIEQMNNRLAEEFPDAAAEFTVSAMHILILDEAAEDPYSYEDLLLEDLLDEGLADETDEAGEQEEDEAAETEEDPYEGLAGSERAERIAEDLLAEILASEDREGTFRALRDEYSEDPGQGEEGYTFGAGTMIDAFYEAALALEVGEVSAPVRNDQNGGWHIIYRLPLDEEYVEENYDSLEYGNLNYLLTNLYDSVFESLAVTYGDYYGQLTAMSIR